MSLPLFLRSRHASLQTTAPALMSFKALKSQFDWLLDGELANLVTKNLQQELKNMELVLRYGGGGFFAAKSSDTSINQLEMLRSCRCTLISVSFIGKGNI